MKSIYQAQILKEKLRSNQNKGLIQRLQNYLEKDTPITKEIFCDTGMIVSANTFTKEYEGTISKDCEAVLTYIGDNYIQSLKSGEWMALINGKKVKDKNAKVIEDKLYKSVKSKLIANA